LPLNASQVDTNRPFSTDELLYRRVGPTELNSLGELLPTTIAGIQFTSDVQHSPSVMRSDFSEPSDVLHVLCAKRDVAGWSVYFIRVDKLPSELVSGDNKRFCFFPVHMPEETCGAHSVVACCLLEDPNRVYRKPSGKVEYDFKVKLALALRPIGQVYDIVTRKPL